MAALFFINRDDVFEDFKLTLAVHQALGAFESAGCKPVVIRNPERGGALPSKKDDYSSTTERFPGLAFHEDVDNGIRTAMDLPMGGWVGYPRRSYVCDADGKICSNFESDFDPQAHCNYALKVLREMGWLGLRDAALAEAAAALEEMEMAAEAGIDERVGLSAEALVVPAGGGASF